MSKVVICRKMLKTEKTMLKVVICKKISKTEKISETEKIKTNSEEENIKNDDRLSVDFWKNILTLKNVKMSQIEFYTIRGSSPAVLQLVGENSKSFGTLSEYIVKVIFLIDSRTSSGNDGTRNGKKIEIKTARYWACTNNCKWQHIELTHDYDYVLFALLDFHGWIVWGISKSMLIKLKCLNILTNQGKQGMWVSKNSIIPYVTRIKNIADLDHELSLI